MKLFSKDSNYPAVPDCPAMQSASNASLEAAPSFSREDILLLLTNLTGAVPPQTADFPFFPFPDIPPPPIRSRPIPQMPNFTEVDIEEYLGFDEAPQYGLSEEEKQFLFVVEGVVLTGVSIFGIVGTLLSIGVLVKPALRESFSALLTGLAVCDTLFLVTSLIMFGLPKLWHWFAVHVTTPWSPYTFGLLHIWRVGSTYLTLSVTLERYCAICHPLKAKIRQRYLLVATLVFATVYNIPRFFEIQLMELENGELVTISSDMRHNAYYEQFYVFWSKFILIELVPYCVIIVLNALICSRTLKAAKFRGRFRRSDTTATTVSTGSTAISSCKIKGSHPLVRKTIENESDRKMSLETTECLLLKHRPSNCGERARLNSTEKDSDAPACRLPSDSAKNPPVRRQTSSQPPESPTEATANTTASASPPPTQQNNVFRTVSMTAFRSTSGSVSSTGSVARAFHRESSAGRAQNLPSLPLFRRVSSNIPNGSSNSARGSTTSPRLSGPTASTVVAGGSDRALGATLVGVSLLFIACQSLKLIPDVYEGFLCERSSDSTGGYCRGSHTINVMITLSNLLMCVNSAANFLMYMLRGSKFRRAFVRTYWSGCPATAAEAGCTRNAVTRC